MTLEREKEKEIESRKNFCFLMMLFMGAISILYYALFLVTLDRNCIIIWALGTIGFILWWNNYDSKGLEKEFNEVFADGYNKNGVDI